MLFLVMYGFSSLPQIDGWAMLILGVVGFLAFIRWELRAKSPVFNVRLFKNSAFTFSSLAALINYSATYADTYSTATTSSTLRDWNHRPRLIKGVDSPYFRH